MIRLLLADDHKLVRDGLQSIFAKTQDMQVVGQAASGREVLSLLETLSVDVVLMDIDMPDGADARPLNGVEATRLVRERFPQVKVVMLTMADNEQWARESLEAGAQGYMLKSAGHQELLHAIRTVAGGEEYFSTDLTKMLLLRKENPAAAPVPVAAPARAAAQPLPTNLSPRELEVLGLIAQGYTNHQIGELLFTSRRTVETHRQNLLSKTQSPNTATLIHLAIQQGWVK